MNLSDWNGAPRPERVVLDGRYARLEPIDAARHSDGLFAAAHAPGAEDRFRYLLEDPSSDPMEFRRHMETAAASTDPLFHAVIDKATGRVEGRQAYLRIDPANGVIEIGHIMWGPGMARTRIATEAFYLFAGHVFDMGYRRFEWKCNALNEPSRLAAGRFGFTFEGVFRQHMVSKGMNRDSAWFSILDGEWPRLKKGYERWLEPENFDSSGQQRAKLTF